MIDLFLVLFLGLGVGYMIGRLHAYRVQSLLSRQLAVAVQTRHYCRACKVGFTEQSWDDEDEIEMTRRLENLSVSFTSEGGFTLGVSDDSNRDAATHGRH